MKFSSPDSQYIRQSVKVRGTSARRLETIGFTAGLLVMDVLTVGLAMRLAFLVRFRLNLPFFEAEALSSPLYYESLVFRFVIPVYILVFALRGLYSRQNLLGGTYEYDLIFQASTLAMFSAITVGFFEPSFIIARGWALIAWFLTFLTTVTGRFIYRRLIYSLRGKGLFLSRAVIIGCNDEAQSMAEQLRYSRNSGLQVMGFIAEQEKPQATYRGLAVLGGLEKIDRVLREHHIEEIIVASSALNPQQIVEIFQAYGVSSKVRLRLSSGLYEMITTGMQVREIAWVPLVEVNKVRMTGLDMGLKAVLDYGMTIPGVILLSPVFLLLALAVKLDSPGPIIHRRRVLGVNGKVFDAFKFRTMYTNGNEILNRYPEKKAELLRNHKLKDDPRITRVGYWLRKLSLDELPQLFNVLRNEMSLVGPRMITPEEVTEYDRMGMNLLTVKPGITGKWQVSGRSDVTYQERVRLDMYYIRNWTIWMDVQLLVQTIPAVLLRRGAY